MKGKDDINICDPDRILNQEIRDKVDTILK
jgi:hypothetical protein